LFTREEITRRSETRETGPCVFVELANALTGRGTRAVNMIGEKKNQSFEFTAKTATWQATGWLGLMTAP
jgi:hypothetical protein